MVSESIKEEVKSMKFKLVPHKFTPKGKSELCAYSIQDLEKTKQFQSMVGKLHRQKIV